MNLLIIGDRKPLNDSDLSFAAIREAGHDVTFLYRGPEYPFEFGIAVDDSRPLEQIAQIVREKQIDAIYFRVDWFDKLYTLHGRAIMETDFGVPIIFGYHCHTCHRTDLEAHSFEQADALVLLNQESKLWFNRLYGTDKPTMLMPSLLFPRRAWYDVPTKPKLSMADGKRHLVIPSNVIRCASVPAKLDPAVPIENYVIDRYDYLRLIEQLAKRGIIVHVYGKFVVQGGGDASDTERAYRAIANQYPGRVYFDGRVDQRDFATELSQYDGALLTGFVPYQPVPKFDHMNYQVRFNPVLAAGLPSFIPAGTTSCGERELKISGAGFVFTSFEHVVDLLANERKLRSASESARQLQGRHSMEPWVAPLMEFFAEVVERFQNRSSSQAA